MPSAAVPPFRLPRLTRNAAIVASVVVMHVVALWALQNGLFRRAIEVVVPAQVLVEWVAPPPPAPAAAPPAPQTAPQPTPAKPVLKPTLVPPRSKTVPRPAPLPEPQPLAVEAATPSAPVVAVAPPAPVAPATAPVTAPAPPAPAVVQPSSSAAYLNNQPPPYPAMSRRLGETGRVVVRVLIGTDGRAMEAQIQKSSGYERLDQVALETARDRWRYVPGTRGGVPEAMWFNVPIHFVLQ